MTDTKTISSKNMSRNIVLIVLDTVRKDFFNEYAPRLREEADIEAHRCYAASTWTVPSHASMLTGSLPHKHGVHACTPIFSKISYDDTFLSELPNHRSVAINSNFTLNTKDGFCALFDEYKEIDFTRFGYLNGGIDLTSFAAQHDGGPSKYLDFLKEAVEDGNPLASILNGTATKVYDSTGWLPEFPRYADYGAKEGIEGSKQALAGEEPAFLYANFMEAHMPHRAVSDYDQSLFSVPNSWSSYNIDNWDLNTATDSDGQVEYLENLRQLYGASIDYLDKQISEFIDWTKESTDNETTVIVTSDHGENLGYEYENNLIGHAASGLSEGLLHVPLLIFNPPDSIDVEELDRPITQLDIGTLCHSLLDGQGLDLERKSIPAERVCLPGRDSLSNRLDQFEHWDRAERCLYHGNTKVIWDSLGRVRKFAVGNGPSKESRSDEPIVEKPDTKFFTETIEDYKQRIDDRCGTDIIRDTSDVDAAVKERLKNLGYG